MAAPVARQPPLRLPLVSLPSTNLSLHAVVRTQILTPCCRGLPPRQLRLKCQLPARAVTAGGPIQMWQQLLFGGLLIASIGGHGGAGVVTASAASATVVGGDRTAVQVISNGAALLSKDALVPADDGWKAAPSWARDSPPDAAAAMIAQETIGAKAEAPPFVYAPFVKPAACGINNPCQVCDSNQQAICSISSDEDGDTLCVQICGAENPETVLMSLRNTEEKCMPDASPGSLKNAYLKLCPNATRASGSRKNRTTSCQFDAKGIEFAAFADNDGGLSSPDGGSIFPRCIAGYSPSQKRLECARGALFPSTYSCLEILCTAPKHTDIPNSFAGGSCKEGREIGHGKWCTPRCMSGFRPVWHSEDNGLIGALGCDWSTRPSQASMCCHKGILTPSSFQCEAYLELSRSLSTVVMRMLLNVAAETGPEGLKLRSIQESAQNKAEHIYVEAEREGKPGVATDLVGIDAQYEFEADMRKPMTVFGRGKFLVDMRGDARLVWMHDGFKCTPNLNCNLTLLNYTNHQNNTSNQIEGELAATPENFTKWPWMSDYEEAFGWNVCNKLYEYAVGAHSKSRASIKKLSSYQCDGTDPKPVLFVPVVVGTICTFLFWWFSPSLLLRSWKKRYLAFRRHERTRTGNGGQNFRDTAAPGGRPSLFDPAPSFPREGS
eukprot:TRINITY_DN40877_c0_g1_i1.p1 TRINITY_DN40877_c0_g1~~TRINITY_DN40877_c0_g1_i1.p1  ORF type:complete len:664 (+),score=76.34 TRINITY_DN40877_c0_g1_i1:162-2153(+)